MLPRKKVDTDSYHKLCSASGAFSREELEQTLTVLDKAGSEKKILISEALKFEAIEKPELHSGGNETDFILICIQAEDADGIIEELGNMEVQAVSPEGNTTPLASRYGALLDRWLNYVESL